MNVFEELKNPANYLTLQDMENPTLEALCLEVLGYEIVEDGVIQKRKLNCDK